MNKENTIKLDTDKILNLLIDELRSESVPSVVKSVKHRGALWIRVRYSHKLLCDKIINALVSNRIFNMLRKDDCLNYFDTNTLLIEVILENNILFAIVTDEETRETYPQYKVSGSF